MLVYADTEILEEMKQVSPSKGKEKGGAVASFAWHDVRCSYVDKRGQEKEVLHGVSGYLDGGHMLAVIGPSGSGKTCLMDVLAGRKSIGRFSGTRLLDNRPIDEKSLKQRSAYVSQDDVFHPTATVGEAVLFQANLRLGPDVSASVKQAKVAVALDEVGLRDKADRYVGGELPGGLHLRGLSGGEKRRLSLCCAIITEPGVLFLDEPTSGLDSFSALVVMHQLKAYCEAGVTVICTIHQPRSAIWALFQKVLVLSCGHELYFGPADHAEQWFTDILGYPRPHDASAADYLLDVVNTDYSGDSKARQRLAISAMQGEGELQSAAACFRGSERFAQTIGKYNPGVSPSASPSVASSTSQPTPLSESLRLWCWELRVLLGRIVYMYARNPGNLMARLLVVLWCSAIQCVFFFKTGNKVVNIGGFSLNIAGAAFMSTAMGSMLPFNSITMFLFDRQYFKREAAGGLYSHSAYYVAYSLLEMLLATVSALLMGSICYPVLDYAAFVASWRGNFQRFLMVLVLHTNVGNQMAIFYSLLSPNQDIARALMTGHVMIAFCAAGVVVPRPWMTDFGKMLTYVSDIRYAFQALMIDLYTGTQQEHIITMLQLDEPRTVLGNVLCSAVFYVSALVGGYFCLRLLNKEQR